jgi:hypothetical protein
MLAQRSWQTDGHHFLPHMLVLSLARYGLASTSFNQPAYRGMRVNGVRVAMWSSQNGWSGDGRPDTEWLH